MSPGDKKNARGLSHSYNDGLEKGGYSNKRPIEGGGVMSEQELQKIIAEELEWASKRIYRRLMTHEGYQELGNEPERPPLRHEWSFIALD